MPLATLSDIVTLHQHLCLQKHLLLPSCQLHNHTHTCSLYVRTQALLGLMVRAAAFIVCLSIDFQPAHVAHTLKVNSL